MDYIVRLGRATRDPAEVGRGDLKELIVLGVSPRAYQHVLALARVTAFHARAEYAIPADVKEIFCDAARHRIARGIRAQAENIEADEILNQLLRGGSDSMIPENVMRELRYIEVYTAKKIRNLRFGSCRSPLQGQGFDFDEHKPYRPGDDVRRIDWDVTARMGTPYVRHTHAERELNVMIVMDVSRSMDLGTSHYSKKEMMTFITGSLLFSALSDQINTGFLAFADRVMMSTRRAARAPPRGRCSSSAGPFPRHRGKRRFCRPSGIFCKH